MFYDELETMAVNYPIAMRLDSLLPESDDSDARHCGLCGSTFEDCDCGGDPTRFANDGVRWTSASNSRLFMRVS